MTTWVEEEKNRVKVDQPADAAAAYLRICESMLSKAAKDDNSQIQKAYVILVWDSLNLIASFGEIIGNEGIWYLELL